MASSTDQRIASDEHGSCELDNAKLLPAGERESLLDVVWPKGDARRQVALRAWFQQGIGEIVFDVPEKSLLGAAFCKPSRSFPLLIQHLNGPCGLLAVVQAELAWRFVAQSNLCPSSPETFCKEALIDAVESILIRVSRVISSRGESRSIWLVLSTNVACTDIWALEISTVEMLRAMLTRHIGSFIAAPGAALLLYSLALTAGLDAIRLSLSGTSSSLGTPLAESLVACTEEQMGGFCEVALVSLAAFGYVVNSFTDSAWSAITMHESEPDLGTLTSEDAAVGEEVVAKRLRSPQHRVWVVLSGGHYITLCEMTEMPATEPATAPTVAFLFLDGLNKTVLRLSAIVDAHPTAPDTEGSLAGMQAVEIVQRRQHADGSLRYYVICQPTGSLEAGSRARDSDLKWYCRDCYLSEPRSFAFNAADSSVCKECGKPDVECGYGHWLLAAEVPPALLHEYEREKAPWQLRVLWTNWPRLIALT